MENEFLSPIGDSMLPQARNDRLVVQPVDGELLVYDLERDRAHCLNPLTALVWRHADGNTAVDALTERVRRESPGPVDEIAVRSALESLGDAHLLVERVESPTGDETQSRRDVMRNAAAIGGLAAIASIVAPTPAQAQTLPPDPGPD